MIRLALWPVVLLLALLLARPSQAQVLPQDSLALVALYNATDGPNWTVNLNWLTAPVSQWFGVTVTGDRVTRLDLRSNQLTGSIPPELGTLTDLTFLRLDSNQLTGSIPVELGTLANLTFLDLRSNQLTGSIPVELGTLANLISLFLVGNQLTGSIPVELGNLSNLTGLDLRSNQLTGSIPVELGTLTNLGFLDLVGNQLTGSIPVELGTLTNLGVLNLGNNELTGSIPVELGTLTKLGVLNLGFNQLSGVVPLVVAQVGAAIEIAGGFCSFTPNDPSLCIPDTQPYLDIGVDPICGLPLSASCGRVTRYVATTGSDTGNDCTNPANPCATIAHAVGQADDSDTLDVAAGTYNEPGLLIEKNLIIQGQGVLVQ